MDPIGSVIFRAVKNNAGAQELKDQKLPGSNHVCTIISPRCTLDFLPAVPLEVPRIPEENSGRYAPKTRTEALDFPQLTTIPEELFYPQQTGPSTSVDFRRQEKPQLSRTQAQEQRKSPILERMGLENMPAIT